MGRYQLIYSLEALTAALGLEGIYDVVFDPITMSVTLLLADDMGSICGFHELAESQGLGTIHWEDIATPVIYVNGINLSERKRGRSEE